MSRLLYQQHLHHRSNPQRVLMLLSFLPRFQHEQHSLRLHDLNQLFLDVAFLILVQHHHHQNRLKLHVSFLMVKEIHCGFYKMKFRYLYGRENFRFILYLDFDFDPRERLRFDAAVALLLREREPERLRFGALLDRLLLLRDEREPLRLRFEEAEPLLAYLGKEKKDKSDVRWNAI